MAFHGRIQKKRFEPSQPFALALRAQDFDQVLDFPADDERLQRYLRGETLDVSDLINGEKKRKGWQLVMVAGYPLGFGKLVNNNLKINIRRMEKVRSCMINIISKESYQIV